MDPTIQTEKNLLICRKNNHNQTINYVDLKKFAENKDSMFCTECLKSYLDHSNLLTIDQAIHVLKQKQQQSQTTEFIPQELQQIIISLERHYNALVQNQQINNSVNQEETLTLHQEGIQQQDQHLIHEQKNIIQLEQVNSFKQNEWCLALAFNPTGTLLVAAFDGDFKIWRFEKEKLTEIKKIPGFYQEVSCLTFSKKHNWFASGSLDHKVQCWKEYSNGEWVNYEPKQQHINHVAQLVLNRDEDQLITCSFDKTIKVWKADCEKNQLELDYTLQKKHNSTVFGISLNDSETALVSCSDDKTIILWIKDENNKWIYQNQIVNNDIGKSICFIDDNSIIWQQSHKGIVNILEIKERQLIKKQELNMILDKEPDDNGLFPTIVNKKSQTIVQKHGKYIHFLQQQTDGKLKIKQSIDCISSNTSGAITNQGDYFILWNESVKEFRVYKIHYE